MTRTEPSRSRMTGNCHVRFWRPAIEGDLMVEFNYPPRATGGRDETFDLVVFAHHEVREVMRGGIWHKEIGSPSWDHLSRREVEVLVGSTVQGV